ncbi:MFS transporter [Herbiconiux moechotypicola]|uniref:MFS transporter n=1 Tax=Herbiconiux moechotypicola TaxID=637393 RepID=A0ABN3DCY1_9MICO|nr:MFS transporter [Herbiconiux moechotypicola]MCS5729134.1 MFS transporter [Herbiconiux moechotypicola]
MRRGGLALYAAAAASGRLAARASALAITLLAVATTGDPLVAGAVTAFTVLPSLVLGPLLGMIVDRATRPKRLYLAAPPVFAASLTAVALTLGAGLWPLALLFAFITGCATPLFEGAMTPLVVSVVPAEKLARGYAVDVGTYSVSAIIGPLVATFTAALWGPFWAVVAAAVIALPAWAFIALLSIPMRGPRILPPFRVRDVWTGLVVLTRVPQLRGTTVASSLASFGKDAVLPLAVTLLAFEWGRAAEEGGLLLVAHALGGVLGSVIVAVRPIGLRYASRILYLSLVVSGLAFVLLGFTDDPTLTFVVMFACGLLNGPMTTSTIIVRSAYTPEALRTQVFTTAMSLRATSAAGALVGGALGAAAGGSGLLVFIGLSQLGAAGLGLLAGLPWGRRPGPTHPGPHPAVGSA